MSLQLDPFLFSSFQALAELGDTNLDASSIFGGSVLRDITKELPGTGSTNYHPSSETMINDMKTPLQPMSATPLLIATSSTVPTRMGAARAIGFETPGLTPINHRNESFVTTRHNNGIPSLNNRSSVTPITTGAGAMVHQHSKFHNTTTNEMQISVMRRAKQIVGRQYYPPSPDTTTTNASATDFAPSSVSHSAATPVTSVTRSMRYLRGLGAVEGGAAYGARSLFPSSISENQSSNSGFNSSTNIKSNINNNTTNHDTNNNDVKIKSKPEIHEKDGSVQEILNILTISGAAYQNICQYRCRDAIHLLQQLPISQQRTAWVLHQQGRAFLEQGDFMSAQRCFEYMHSIDPGRMQGLELLSTVYWQLKKEIDLANLAQRTMDWDYESPQAHCVAGNCFSLQKDQETALIFFKRSLQLDPNFTYVHTLSGYEYMANEDFSNAILCFRKALQLDDRHYNAWYGLGMIYHRQEKYDLAEYHFERAVTIHPTSGVLRCNLGMAQNANGKAYMALETLSEAFRLDPRNPQARFQRATIYSSLHRPEEALAELKIVRDAAPREATVHFAMGKILKRLGRLDEAMKCFLTAMDLDPKDNQMIKSAMDKLGEADGDEEGSTNY
jgi:anaphase-promoting complex subunit 3